MSKRLALARYQGIDALLHMEQYKLRVLACCAADDGARLVRYTGEMRRCNQAICRIRREREKDVRE